MNARGYNLTIRLRTILGTLPGATSIGLHAFEGWAIAGTLRRWIRSGRLAVRRAGHVYRIARAELEDFLQREGRSADVVARASAIVTRQP